MPVSVSCRLRQTLSVGGKTLFAWLGSGGEVAGLRGICITGYDTVVVVLGNLILRSDRAGSRAFGVS
jgi:hypothetical protein